MFVAQVILQPLFLLFVFGKVLSALGYTRGGYADLLFPGLLALTAMIRAIQALRFRLWWSSAGPWISRTACWPRWPQAFLSFIFTPLLFTGCVQYPWPPLARLEWFQVVTAANPMTDISESMRAAFVPSIPHIAAWICLLVLDCSLAVLMAIGVAAFTGERLTE